MAAFLLFEEDGCEDEEVLCVDVRVEEEEDEEEEEESC